MDNNRIKSDNAGVSREEMQAAYRLIEELRAEISDLRKQVAQNEIYKEENTRALSQMSVEYNKVCSELAEVKKENESLKFLLNKTIEEEQMKTNEIFGRSSEKLDDILDAPATIEVIDEATEETKDLDYDRIRSENITHNNRGKKKSGKRDADFSKLPEIPNYLIDVEALNKEYGEYNWRIVRWKVNRKIEFPKMTAYVLKTFVPVISVGLEHEIVSFSSANELYPGSFVSASLAAEIFYQKYALFLPVYRIENEFRNMGLNISRQTMCNWINNFAAIYFWMIYNYMIECLMDVNYHQADETTYETIMDGRPAGSKSYIWVHRTSELCECNPIIVFVYELTRGTDHLREFYGDDAERYITCDAYCAYQTFEKEHESVKVCCCFAHMRRRYADALSLIDKKDMSEEQISSLTETQALILIGKVYTADNALKNMTPEQRKAYRDICVRPLVEEYFQFVEAVDISNPALSEKCRDAIQYSLNQKEKLMNFLLDGNLPLDNNAAERSIKSVALLRKASLFSYSIEGAQANAIMHTIVETAKANGANAYWYIRYILESLPAKLDGTDRSFLGSMMPWASEYKEYEREHCCCLDAPYEHSGLSEKPKTPRKKDRLIIA